MRHARTLAPLVSWLLAAPLALAGAPAAAAAPPPPRRPARVAPPSPPAPPPAPAAPLAEAAPAPELAHRAGDWPAKPSGRRVSLDEDLTLDDALARIAEAGGFSLVAHSGKLGERDVAVRLRNVPVEDAIDAVLEGTPLVATRRGDLVTVAPAPRGSTRPLLTGFATPTGKRFTGDFKDAPADQALRKVADAAGFSVVFPPGLRGPVNGHFKDAPVEDALRAILAQAGVVASLDGQVLTVSRPGGASLVIEGSKHGFQVHVDGLDDLGDQITSQVQREIAGEADHAEAGADEADATQGGHDEVLHGDQLIGPGEHPRSVVVLGGSVTLAPGVVAREVTAVGGGVDLGPGAGVERQVVAVGGDVHVAPGAHVGKDVVSVGGKIVIDPGGSIGGERVSVQVPGLGGLLRLGSGVLGTHASPFWRIGGAFLEFAVFFLLGLLVMVVVPRRVEGVAAALTASPVKGVLTGILGWIAVPFVCLLLVITLVGIPFVPVVILALAAATLLGFTALAAFLGRLVPVRLQRGAPVVQLAIGTAFLVLIGEIPVIGPLTWMAAGIYLLGVNLLTRLGKPPAPPAPAYATVPPPAAPPAPPAAPPPPA